MFEPSAFPNHIIQFWDRFFQFVFLDDSIFKSFGERGCSIAFQRLGLGSSAISSGDRRGAFIAADLHKR
jgi:hypothetical protein